MTEEDGRERGLPVVRVDHVHAAQLRERRESRPGEEREPDGVVREIAVGQGVEGGSDEQRRTVEEDDADAAMEDDVQPRRQAERGDLAAGLAREEGP